MLQQKSLFRIVLTGCIILLLNISGYSQKFTGSPYSRFGVGELTREGMARNNAMGGTGIALRDGLYLNPLNPASFTSLDSTSFIFDVGASGGIYQFKSHEGEQSDNTVNFEYFALGFSAKKWWGISAGIRQVTDVGYEMDFSFENKNSSNYNVLYKGSGGVNKVYLSNAFKLSPKLSVGITANYNWGKVEYLKSLTFEGGAGIPYNSQEVLTVSNLNFDFGAQYEGKFNKKYRYVLGVTAGNKTDLTGEYSLLKYRRSTLDTIDYTSANKSKLELPNRFGIGIAIAKSEKLIMTLDANYQAWGNVASIDNTNDELTVKLKNSIGLGAGIEYTPRRYIGMKFFDRVSYRGGLYYNKSRLEINGTQLNEYGVTAGVGLPIRGTSYCNLGIELGTRGTQNNNLIKEKFARVSVSFSLFERWFQKILYN